MFEDLDLYFKSSITKKKQLFLEKVEDFVLQELVLLKNESYSTIEKRLYVEELINKTKSKFGAIHFNTSPKFISNRLVIPTSDTSYIDLSLFNAPHDFKKFYTFHVKGSVQQSELRFSLIENYSLDTQKEQRLYELKISYEKFSDFVCQMYKHNFYSYEDYIDSAKFFLMFNNLNLPYNELCDIFQIQLDTDIKKIDFYKDLHTYLNNIKKHIETYKQLQVKKAKEKIIS